ncbi:hypothetical protein AB0P21_20800 [Kribbella sp. NPDC056861]|uniref:hypothetical protein n=1 Tax=Kribbella sp. NPDC056861 TaxID=3154857 RepID=UPI00343C0459
MLFALVLAEASCSAPSGSQPPTPAASAQEPSVAGSPFVGEWSHHHTNLTIRGDGTATMIGRWDDCPADKPCFLEYTLQAHLTKDKKALVARVSAFRLVVYENSGKVVPMATPDWGASGPPNDVIGTTYNLIFAGPNLLHDTILANEGLDYWCNVKTSLKGRSLCGG